MAGCDGHTGSDTADGPPLVVEVDGDPPILATGTSKLAVPDVLVSATLSYDQESQCLRTTRHNHQAVVWPPDSRGVVADDGRRGVEVPSHGLVLEGDRFSARGGSRRVGILGTEQDEPAVTPQERALLSCADAGEPVLTVVEVVEILPDEAAPSG